MYRTHNPNDEVLMQSLRQKGEELEQYLLRAEHAESERQEALMEYLQLLNENRAAEVGVWFSERMLNRVHQAFLAHPTTDLAIDLLYACVLVQQFHSMAFDPWRSHPAINLCSSALQLLEAEGKLSDCCRFSQSCADTYAEANWWPEALACAKRSHKIVKRLLKQGITVLEDGELLDLRDTAFAICLYAQHTADGVSDALIAELQNDLSPEMFDEVVQDVQEAMPDMEIDPVERTPEYLKIRYELEEKIDEALEHQRGYYDYCKEYWMAKRLILRSDYGISWKSPATLNPNIEFH